MSTSLEAYRIFIASPGGLKDIRECFRATVEKYNEVDANRRGVVFIPVGWELTRGGVGRPQDIINDDLKECDYCILVLHDRWGTPAANAPGGPTGTQEEFELAMKLFGNPAAPMQRVVVFFRAVGPGKMSDPGKQLQQVLDFRTQIEAEKKHLYHQIEGENDFADFLRGHLAQWVRDHEGRVRGGAIDETFEVAGTQFKLAAPASSSSSAAEELSEPIASAQRLIAESNFTEAERVLAIAAAKNDDPTALLAYAELLGRLNRRRQAIKAFEAAIALASEGENQAVGARALLGLARLRDDLGEADPVEEAAQKARVLYESIADRSGAARSRILLGERRRRAGLYSEAEAEYFLAIELVSRGEDVSAEADAWIGLSEVFRDQERFDGSREALSKGILLKQRAGVTDLGDAYAALGAVLENIGDQDGADKHFRMSLDLFRQKGDRSGMADAADHLGQVCLRRGDTDGAEDAFRHSASMFEVLQNVEGAADAYLSLGRLQSARGDVGTAESSFRSALSLAVRRHGEAALALQAEITTLLEAVLAA